MMEAVARRRFRLSIRSIMVAIALVALLLAPLLWVARQNARARQEALRAMQLAQAMAERARYVAEVNAAKALLAAETAEAAAEAEAAASAGRSAAGKGGLWAAIGVNHPVFRRGETKDLLVEFSLVNDGDGVVDPKIGASRILIDGQELADSGFILSNGPKDARFEALPPKDHLRFGYALGDYFRGPGVYRVSWKGEGFDASEIVIRVLPE
jgi:hypothetical protein